MLLSIVPSTVSTIAVTSFFTTSPHPSSITHLPQGFQERGIPPERVGLNGEYDHAGLAKRVIAALQEDEIFLGTEGLRVSQRGQVVILSGQVESQELLKHIIVRSLQLEGAAFVESNGVRVMETHRSLDAA
jgi:hypothetical protein